MVSTSISACNIVLVLPDVTVEGIWVKGTWDLFVLFLTIAYESTLISKFSTKKCK